jgi:DNA-binding NarL/FixJ family response regulator
VSLVIEGAVLVDVQGAVLVEQSPQPGALPAKASHPDSKRNRSLIAVLVVDDSEPFRQFVCSTLGERPDLQVIGEASDGLEAVRKAEELEPALIVLDIGLPGLNGLEVARRIRKLSPKSTILFLSQEACFDVVQEALTLGAMGYVVKAHAGSELLVAVEAVLRNEKFVSSSLKDVEGQR